MSLSHDRAPETAPQVPESAVCQTSPARPNLGTADYPIAQGGGAEAAGVVLAADPLAEFYYEALVQDPIAGFRDALFTCYLHNWPGFNQMLGVVDTAARAELDALDDPSRAESLQGLRPGLAAGKAALRQEATPFELDILLGALDATTAPLTASFVGQVYEGASLRLAHQLRDHASSSGDSELLCRAHQLMTLLGVGGPSSGEICPVEVPIEDANGWDKVVDWAVSGAGDLVDSGANALAGTPVLGDVAAAVAPAMKFGQELVGGVAKGAGDMVGGLASMVAHPIDALKGIGTMLEHVPGSPLKSAHKLYDIAAGDRTLDETFLRNPLTAGREDLSADWEFWKQVGGALIEPYEKSIEQGKYGEALGRGIFDIGGLFVGASELKALGKGAETVSVLNKVDDTVKIASKVNELGAVTDDLVRAGSKADDVTKAASPVDEAADLGKVEDATKLANEAEEAVLPLPSKDEPAQSAAAVTPSSAPTELVDLTTPSRRTHILDSDATGGGHRAGTGKPGKTEFPASWSDDQIMHQVSDIATDPHAVPDPSNSPRLYDRRGRPIRHSYTSVRDGVEIQVVVEPATGEIISSYPTGLVDGATGEILPYPRNPPAAP